MIRHSITRREFAQGLSHLGAALGVSMLVPSLRSAEAQQGSLHPTLEEWYKRGPNNSVFCDICPHNCHLQHGQTGICRTHINQGGKLFTTSWANPCVLQPGPVEQAPIYHLALKPDTKAMYIAAAGAVLQPRDPAAGQAAPSASMLGSDWVPEKTVEYTLRAHDNIPSLKGIPVRVLAFGRNDPVASLEYCLAIAKEAKGQESRNKRLSTAMVTTGYINEKPLNDILPYIDAFVIDLKGFTEEVYRDHWGGRLAPVLNVMKSVKKAGKWVEVSYSLVAGENDDPDVCDKMCKWIVTNLGPDTPLHFQTIVPKWRMGNVPRTPVATLDRCYRIGVDAGLKFVYIASIPGHNANSTYCPKCGARAIHRVGVKCMSVMLDKKGRCKKCKHQLPGIWTDM